MRLRSYAFKSLDMVGAIKWLEGERDALHAMQASQYRSRARQQAETRPWSAAIGASNGRRSLVSSAQPAQQSRERLLHAGDNDGAQQRTCGYRGRRLVHRIRQSCHAPLEVAREHVADASRQITDDRTASELRQRSEQEGAHRNIDPGRGSALLRAQPVFDLGARPRGAEPISARSQDHAAL